MRAVPAGLVVGTAAVAACLGWLRRSLILVSVSGDSMEPALSHGDRVLVRRRPVAKVRRHDIVVIAPGKPAPGRLPGGWLVKRVLAVPGDPVPRERLPALARVPEDVVPAGRLVVLGDNAAASSDSRDQGYFHGALLLGVVVRSFGRAAPPAGSAAAASEPGRSQPG